MCPIAVVHREPAGQPPSKQAQNRRRDASERRATVRDGALGYLRYLQVFWVCFTDSFSKKGIALDLHWQCTCCGKLYITTTDTGSAKLC